MKGCSIALKVFGTVGGLLWLVAGCVHPLSRAEVESLTTCHDTELKKIRKSLLLNDYEIRNETDTDLVTGWKQVNGYGSDRTLQRITVVKLDDKTYRFKVRLRYLRIERDDERFGYPGPYRRRHSVVFDFSQPMEMVSDEDPTYDEEQLGDYEETQREVCGS